MPLINCPECSHQISDRAQCCPNCGYPLTEISNLNISETNNSEEQNYCVIFNRLGQPNKIDIIKMVRQIGNYDLKTAKDIVDFPPSVIIKNISQQAAKDVQKKLDLLGAVVSIEKLNSSECQNNSKQEIAIKRILNNNKDDTIRCPRCGSTSVTTGQKGFSLLTGFLGSNKTVNRCGKCGYSWQPKN